jgi:hypothetical protein
MAGPLFAVGRALLGSQLTQPIMNEMAIRGLGSGTLSPELARLLYSNRTLGEQLASSVEPLGRLLGFLPEERPNYNLPDDYSVGPQGEIYNLAGDRMVTGEGVTGFQPVAQYGEYGFQEPLPPRPEGYPSDAPWPPPGAGGGFMPAAEGLLSLQQPPAWGRGADGGGFSGARGDDGGGHGSYGGDYYVDELERLAARYAIQPPPGG